MILIFSPKTARISLRLGWLALHLLTIVLINLAFLGRTLTGTDLNQSAFHQTILRLTDNQLTSWLQQTYGQLSGTDAGFLFFSPQIGDDTVFETVFFRSGRATTVDIDGLCDSREGESRFFALVEETAETPETAQLASFSVAHRLLEMHPALDSVQCRYYRQSLPRLRSAVPTATRMRTLLYSFSFSR
jgi:hypothetical protein